MQCSNENDITTKVLTVNAITQTNTQREDAMDAMNTRMRKIEEDNSNILRKLDEVLVTDNNKMYYD